MSSWILRYGGALKRGRRWKGVRLISSSPPLHGVSDRDERYIQYSKVPTMHFQPSLPRLPIPKLPDTCRRYLAALRPLVGEEQYRASEAIVQEFGREGSDGDTLNQRLKIQDSENKHTSYVAEPWSNRYLSDRHPIVINENPFLGFHPDPRTNDQADRATNFIRSAVRFRNSLMDSRLAPEVFHLNPDKSDTPWIRNYIRFVPSTFSWYGAYLVKAFPLDMSQYVRLFNSTRIPRHGTDELVSHGNKHRHLVVLRNGHFYSIDVVQPDGLPVPAPEVHAKLLYILSIPPTPPSHPLSYLTTMDRNHWAELREELVSNEENRKSIEKIDSAMFVLCLDDNTHTTPLSVSHGYLHNYGANRWFDKNFSLIVSSDGLSGINFEHSWGDGVAVLRFFNEIWRDTSQSPYVPQNTPIPTDSGVHHLEFSLSDNLKSAISEARVEMEDWTRTLHFDFLEYPEYGRDHIKAQGLSPDAVLQLAFQVAYYCQHKTSVSTYESCSTAAFRHGRTETIRPLSVASRACAEAFEHDHPAGVEEMIQKVKESSAWHSKLTKEAAMGQGFDRHLFALRMLAEHEGLTPPIFQDPSYSYMNRIILSTSTLPGDTVMIGGFGPVTSDGFGVGYSAWKDRIGCQTSTYPSRDGAELVSQVGQVLEDLKLLFEGRNFKK